MTRNDGGIDVICYARRKLQLQQSSRLLVSRYLLSCGARQGQCTASATLRRFHREDVNDLP